MAAEVPAQKMQPKCVLPLRGVLGAPQPGGCGTSNYGHPSAQTLCNRHPIRTSPPSPSGRTYNSPADTLSLTITEAICLVFTQENHILTADYANYGGACTAASTRSTAINNIPGPLKKIDSGISEPEGDGAEWRNQTTLLGQCSAVQLRCVRCRNRPMIANHDLHGRGNTP